MTSYYLELTQDAYEADTISISDASTIADSASGLDIFNVGDKIRLKGFYQTENQSEYTIATKAAGTITIAEGGLAAEAAGETITIQRVEYFSNGPIYKTSTTSKTRFHYPAVLGISPVVWYDDNGWIRLKDGVVEIGRKAILGDEGLTKFTITDKTQGLRVLVRLASDDTILFDTVAIISDITQEAVSFLVKNEIPDFDLLDAMPDIDSSPSTYDQGRVYPQAFGNHTHVDCQVLDNATSRFFSGAFFPISQAPSIDHGIYGVYDDGVLVPVNGISTSYTIGTSVDFGVYSYTANGNSQTMSPTGAASNNTDWNHAGAAVGGDIRYRWNTVGDTTNNGAFNLLSAPVGRVTAEIHTAGLDATNYTPVPLYYFLIYLFVSKQFTYHTISSDEIYVDGSGDLIDPQGRFLDLWGQTTSAPWGSVPFIIIEGSSLNDGVHECENNVVAGKIKKTAGFATEAAGNWKVSGIFIVDSSQASPTLSTDISCLFSRQIKFVEMVKELCDFYSHFVVIDGGVLRLISRDKYRATISTDEFEIEVNNPPNLLLENSVFAYRTVLSYRVPIQNPVELQTIEQTITIETGVKTGTIEESKAMDTSAVICAACMQKKADLFTNYSQFEVPYSKDGTGIDTSLVPGVRLQFSDWVSGDLIVHEVEWDIENGINRAKGIANNLVYY